MPTNPNNIAREEIFASIQRNLAVSALFDLVHREHSHGTNQPHDTAGSIADRTGSVYESFQENLRSVGGKVHVVHSTQEAVARIENIISEIKPRRIAFSDAPISREIRNSLQTEAELLEKASAAELFDCDVGITSAQWGIAETGTLVLESECESSRLTSLVPGVHICLLEMQNIRRTMGEILDLVAARLSPAVTFITGPSRTSDIELTLAIGVHGPRELYVIVNEDSIA
jgi:L-lactate dehydrogenase complex protein LldG